MTAFVDILGESPAIRVIRAQFERLIQNAGSKGRLPPILLLGQTGTGKGLLAQCVHRASPRSDRPFVAVNCAAIPETLLESEFFGFERGAFTDAHQPKQGLLEAAHKGTLFLDEVGALSLSLQAKLLTTLEERTVRRLGSTTSRPVDVWVVAATNEDLMAAIRDGRFRQDLYHRLAVVTLTLPALQERSGDIRLLAEHFLHKTCTDYGLPPKRLTPDAYTALDRYPFPGNVRELSNMMERIALLVEGPLIASSDLGLPSGTGNEPLVPAAPRKATVREVVYDVERTQVLEALEATGWNLSRAAVQLGLARNTLRHRMRKLNLLREGQAGVPSPVPLEHVPLCPTASPEDRRQWEPRAITFLRIVLDPVAESAAPSLLSQGRSLAVEKIMSFGGLIEETKGGYVQAVFGVEPIEDGPSRAANAALATRAAVRKAAAPGDVPSTVRAAIHVCRCLIDPGGEDVFVDPAERRAAIAVLQTLLRATPADAILASAAASPHLERRFIVSREAVAGGEERASRVIGRAASGLGIRGGPPTPFVGRESELEVLRAAFARAASGHGQVVGITGEPGCGKSRLAYEFRREVLAERRNGIRYVEAHCTSHGGTTPYAPIIGLVRATCGGLDAEDLELVARHVQQATSALPKYKSEHIPYLLHLLGGSAPVGQQAAAPAPGPNPAQGADNPEAVRAYTFEAVKQLWIQLAEQHPIVLVVEDLHWSDSISTELLAALVEELGTARLLLVTTYRPEYVVRWSARPNASETNLEPLPTRASLEVVRGVLGVEQADRQAEQLILERGGGNPFFLEELALAARDQGPEAVKTVPPTIEGVLEARMDRLLPAERRLLQAAAVIGKEFSTALLLAVTQSPAERVGQQLAALQAGEFIHERGPAPGSVYAFKHALTQQVAYESLPPETRRIFHARIAECLERSLDRAIQVEQLAHHAMLGECWEQAVRYLCAAGQKAFDRIANREALACFHHALEALEHLPERENLQTAIDLRFRLRSALFLLGELSAVERYLTEAAQLAKRLEDGKQKQLERAWTYLTHYYWITAQPDKLRDYGERVRRVATQSDDPALRLTANQYVGLAHMTAGDYRAAEAFLRTAVESIPESQRSERFQQPGYPYVTSRGYLALCLADLGEFQAAIALAEEGIRVANGVHHRYSLGIVSWDLAYLYCVKGDVDAANHLLHTCADVHDLDRQASGRTATDPVESARKSTFVLSGPRLLWLLGHAYGLAGRLDQAIDLMEEALARSKSVGMRVYDALTAVHLGEAYLRAGRVDDARATGKAALALAERHEQRGYRAYALRLLGEVCAHPSAPDPVAAEERYRMALMETQELGMRPLEARCHLGLGSLRHLAGEVAKGHRARASTILRDLGMRVPFEPVVA